LRERIKVRGNKASKISLSPSLLKSDKRYKEEDAIVSLCKREMERDFLSQYPHP
jgi:hypothetical protein